MLGDSVKRRLGRPWRRLSGTTTDGSARRWTWRYWATFAGALVLPFLTGYVVAVRVLFPPPAVVAEGIAVPALVGMEVESAQLELVALGLGALEISGLPSATVPEGLIIAQSPLPGQQLRASSSMRVAVSSGPPAVFVPDVVGFPIERAASLLTRLGFQVQRFDTVSNADRGRVLRLDPQPGTRLELPSRVSITVSAGRPDTIPADTTIRGRRLRIGWSHRAGVPMFMAGQVLARHGEVRIEGNGF